jgi:hypothetical protein
MNKQQSENSMHTENKNGYVLLSSSDEWYKRLSAAELEKVIADSKAWCRARASVIACLRAASSKGWARRMLRTFSWAARNSSFLERDADTRLKGFDDRAQSVDVQNRRTARIEHTIKRDYRDGLRCLPSGHKANRPDSKNNICGSR